MGAYLIVALGAKATYVDVSELPMVEVTKRTDNRRGVLIKIQTALGLRALDLLLGRVKSLRTVNHWLLPVNESGRVLAIRRHTRRN